MDVQQAVILNLVLIGCIGALAAFFGPDDFGRGGRAFFAVWASWAVFCLSCTGWIIFVAIHFLSKYW